MINITDKSKCCGCTACVNACPVQCIVMRRDRDEGFDYPVANPDICIGCGKCEKLCPLNNIKIVDKKPVWGNECSHCMACIGYCPVEAIEYGTVSQQKEPYRFGKYRYVIDNLTK